MITFDDGYRDNLTCAYPILEKYGFPATFFLATDYIGTGRLKWEDELNCLVRRSDAPSLTLGQTTYPLGDKTFRTISQLVRHLGRCDRAERRRIIDDLKRQLGTGCEDTEGIMLSWDEARARLNPAWKSARIRSRILS